MREEPIFTKRVGTYDFDCNNEIAEPTQNSMEK